MSTVQILKEPKGRNNFFKNIRNIHLAFDIRKQNITLDKNSASINVYDEISNDENRQKIGILFQTIHPLRMVDTSEKISISSNRKFSKNVAADETRTDLSDCLDVRQDSLVSQEVLYSVSSVVNSLYNPSPSCPYLLSQLLIEKNNDSDGAVAAKRCEKVIQRLQSRTNCSANFNILHKIKSTWCKMKRRKTYQKLK
ncbi:hypothetical protein NPIL_688111 [Nephila pilipes]|uniref:Uncharacterized protein n=1 Tax=Nephila pilipes TaxID=299642 RepID=A0A8X6MHS2_NEPPI|nr:hypothetical protein NPIL_688111 [Nephila pilipes]